MKKPNPFAKKNAEEKAEGEPPFASIPLKGKKPNPFKKKKGKKKNLAAQLDGLKGK